MSFRYELPADKSGQRQNIMLDSEELILWKEKKIDTLKSRVEKSSMTFWACNLDNS